LFGKNATDECKNLMRKIPSKVFNDFSDQGAIFHVISVYLQLESINKMDLSLKKSLMEYFQTLEESLKNSGIIQKKIFLISSKYDEEGEKSVKNLIESLGGEILKEGMPNYLIEPDPLFLQKE
jgi:hypothetical protein